MAIDALGGMMNLDMIQQSVSSQVDTNKTEDFQAALEKAIENKDDEELRNATKEFEAYFIQMIYKQMRSTVNYAGGIFERSNAEVMYQEMLDEEYAKQAAENGSFGLAESMYQQMKYTLG